MQTFNGTALILIEANIKVMRSSVVIYVTRGRSQGFKDMHLPKHLLI